MISTFLQLLRRMALFYTLLDHQIILLSPAFSSVLRCIYAVSTEKTPSSHMFGVFECQRFHIVRPLPGVIQNISRSVQTVNTFVASSQATDIKPPNSQSTQTKITGNNSTTGLNVTTVDDFDTIAQRRIVNIINKLTGARNISTW